VLELATAVIQYNKQHIRLKLHCFI